MRQHGWLPQEKTDSPTPATRIQSSDIRSVPQMQQTPPQGVTNALQTTLTQPPTAYQTYNPTSSALNFSTWFNSPPAEHQHSSIDTILSSINEPTNHAGMYPFANASLQSPPQTGATPSSSDFLRQLLAQQQYQSQGFDFQNGSSTGLQGAPDINYTVGNWSDPATTTEILSNFDFSIEAFNEMLKSSAAEAESV